MKLKEMHFLTGLSSHGSLQLYQWLVRDKKIKRGIGIIFLDPIFFEKLTN